MGRNIAPDATSQSVYIRAVVAATALPDNSVTSATAGIALFYARNGAAKVSITLTDLAGANSAYTSGGIFPLGMGGYFRLDLPDAAVASGVADVVVSGNSTADQIVGDTFALVAAPPTAAATTTAVLTTAMTESYANLHAAPTLAQVLCEIRMLLAEKAISGTTVTGKKIDGSTTGGTYTLNSATVPTSITRAT